MTFEEAYYEWNDLRDLISSWEDETAVTPYSLSVRKRISVLQNWLFFYGPKPCDKKDWNYPTPDLEASVEWYFMNQYPPLREKSEQERKEFIQQHGNKIPLPVPWEQFKKNVIEKRRKYRERHNPKWFEDREEVE